MILSTPLGIEADATTIHVDERMLGDGSRSADAAASLHVCIAAAVDLENEA